MSRGFNVENLISTVNSRAAAELAPFAVFQGTSEDVSGYGRAGISIKSDNPSDGVLTIETSHDGSTWGGPERTFANTLVAQPHMWNIIEKYFRIKYTNGTTKANNLSIQVQYSVNADIILGHQLDEVLIDETEAAVSRSLLFGRDEDGVHKNVPVTKKGLLKTSDSSDTQDLLGHILDELKLSNEYNKRLHKIDLRE